MTTTTASAEAGPSRPSTPLGTGATPYHDSSQLRHWRYSPTRLRQLRQTLNEKAHEVTVRNTELEKARFEAQISLGHTFTDPPAPTAYLSVDDEVLLVRYYCAQAAKIVREGFQLPESLETTAVTYLKRFYLKNSVMEWHPKVVMPTAVYLAAKTTNYPIPMDRFREKFAKLNPDEILEHEFLVAQSLAFEFWVHGPDKALRGWALDFQSQSDVNLRSIQESLNPALQHLRASRLTDAEFIYTPSQISLACFRLANPEMVDAFLDLRYDTADADEVEVHGPPYGMERARLAQILGDVGAMIKQGSVDLDLKVIKGIDKRLKSCANPEKVPGTALYIKRKQEQEAAAAASKAEKTIKLKKEMSEADMLFGDVIQPSRTKKIRRIMSPRVVVGTDRAMDLDRPSASAKVENGTPTGEDTGMEGYEAPASGMGVKDEAMGLLTGGSGLKDVGLLHENT